MFDPNDKTELDESGLDAEEVENLDLDQAIDAINESRESADGLSDIYDWNETTDDCGDAE